MRTISARMAQVWLIASLCVLLMPLASIAQTYLDNETQYSNQDVNTETRRSTHFRHCFGHYNRDTGTPMTEALVQGNLQMFEHAWDRWVTEMGMHAVNDSIAHPEMGLRKANFNFLMTWNDGGGGGAYMSDDGNGFSYAMANTGYCRYDPPSGATPHEMGHVWEGTTGGFDGSTSSGAWWECTANWMQLQFLNTYPTPGNIVANPMYYPAHGRDYYDTWTIWEAAFDDPRYGAAWVNRIWTDFSGTQNINEFILDRMIRCDQSGSTDTAGGFKNLWGDMVKKCITWDYQRQHWFQNDNQPDDGTNWDWYRRCRTPMVKVAGTTASYRPARAHYPMEFGFNLIPLTATAGTTVTCNFQPTMDPVRQSDYRCCLVAVSTNGDARYTSFWSIGSNSITLSTDETKLYLVAVAVPKPMVVTSNAWQMQTSDNGLLFPYTVTFTNASPKNIVYPAQSHTGMHQHSNGGGWVADTATVNATAYVGPNAQVLGTAQVLNYARIEDNAVVYDSAQVRDYAIVSGHAIVYNSAQVYGNAKVRDWARVYGDAQVYDTAQVIEHANVGDTGNKVRDNAICKGTTYLYSPSDLTKCIIFDGDSANGNWDGTNKVFVTADHGVHFGWQWGANTSIFSQLTDNGYVYSQLDFEKDNPVFAMDKYGVMHGFLMNGCKAGIESTRGGLVLPLDGVSQYVELHNGLNDFRETTYSVWVKWTGTANDQRIWSMGNGSNKYMYLTPKNSTTNTIRFVISNGVITQTLDGPAIGTGWTHIAVVFSNSIFNTSGSTWTATGTLYVNGTLAATLDGMIVPDSLNATYMENANYLGRGNSGNYFQGYIDDFRTYMKALTSTEVGNIYSATPPGTVTPSTDTTAPTPNAATWVASPEAVPLAWDPVTKAVTVRSDNSITMSATPGTDASGWVEYYFTCTSGGGHDSGWISMNKYTDTGLTPNTAYTYTVKMRDKAGNMTTASGTASATTSLSSAPTPAFSYGPVGIADGQVKMSAVKQTSPSGKVEYKFDRLLMPSGMFIASSNWQSSPTWTDTGLTAGTSYGYRVSVKDGRGNTSAFSATTTATAKDMAAPQLPNLVAAHWTTQPYATIDNKISMTAMDASDPTGVEYYFHCVSGGGPESGWQASPTYLTPVLADGTYVYQYKVRDKSAQLNESGYSQTSSATVSPLRGYHSYNLTQLSSLADDTLVSFAGTVTQVNSNNYTVKDLASGISIMVKPDTYGEVTDTGYGLKNVLVKGHMWTYGTTKMVTYANITVTGSPNTLNITGTVTESGGGPIAGATVYVSFTANASASPATTATTDASGNYTVAVLPGQWYVAAGYAEDNTSADQIVNVSTTNIHNINFTLTPKPRITGKVIDQSNGGAPVAGATVAFKTSANPMVSPAYTATTDANGNYRQVVTSGTWYIAAGKSNYETTADQNVAVSGITNGINFSLKEPAPRNIPQASNLLFAVVTDPLPPTGSISSWPIYSTTLPDSPTAMSIVGTPAMDTSNTKKWEKNAYSNSATAQGFMVGSYTTAIPVTGASIVMAVKPTRNSLSTTTTSCVEIFGNRLSLGVRNNSGRPNFYINGTQVYGGTATAIASGTTTILSLVVQSTGAYALYANGTSIVTGTATALTSLDPTATGASSNIRVARGDTNTSSYNGDLGDVYVYKTALSTAERQQLEADLTARFINTPTSYTITASAGTGGSMVPGGSVPVYSGNDQTISIVPNTGYGISSVLVDGVSVGAVSSYTFTNVVANHTISATFAAATPYTITASASTGGTISPSGTVTVYSGSSQTFAITPNTGYRISSVTVDGALQGAINTYTFSNVTANHTISAVFTNLNRPVPKSDNLLFSAVTDTFPSSGSTGAWATLCPSGKTLSMLGSPTVATINSKKWEQNNYSENDGYLFQRYSTSIPVNGATAIVAVKPTRNGTGTSWTSVVDVFYDKLVLGVKNDTGFVCVRRNGTLDLSTTAIPDGQITVLTLVVQPTGEYEVLANGTQIMNNTSTSTFTTLNPNHTAEWGSDPDYTHYINVGRNNPDGWTTFNGYIGDVFLYNVALNDADRLLLETDVFAKFSGCTINAAAGANGSINPSGSTSVAYATNQTYTFTPNAGYAVSDVVVDGESVGAPTSYTFTSVKTNHTITVYFGPASYTITASAGSGGSIAPNGVTTLGYGASQAYTITPNAGYAIGQVTVDGVNQGPISSYTFNYVTASHTISATFVPTFTITATAGSNGSISPSGAVVVNSGSSKAFTITSNPGYGISELKIDGTKITPVLGYTFSNITANHTISATFGKIIAMSNRGAGMSIAAGKVVKVWGNVKSINGTTSFVISDGFKETGVTVMNNGVSLPTGFAVGKTVLVTGLMGTDKAVQAQVISIYP